MLTTKGRFIKDYKQKIDFELAAKNINELLAKEKSELTKNDEIKIFRIAVPVPVNLDIANRMNWTYDKEYAYGKFTIRLNGALSSSINFDQFYLPNETEMYVYNESGTMITGPITQKENNPNKTWGSWVYRGHFLTIEIKTPVSTEEQLLLHSNNIAYGYKEVYKSVKVGGFGQSGACNINVLCPLGNGWEPERNSVALGISGDGTGTFSGSMMMNTCNTNRPLFLTANHVYELATPVRNVSGWRFTFQAWSATCTPSQNSDGVTYNGSTLRANWANSDFCLVELNNTPPANSDIHYSGWTTSTIPAQNTTGIHHPSGDVMKISRAANPVIVASAFGTTNQHWQADWTQGVTEGGSSGSPLYDQNHRIIGQLHGGPSACGASQLWDFYGRFDLSWIGGGTNATRLSNWLDPNNTGAATTNTTNVAILNSSNPNSYSISGPNEFCTSANYTISGGSLCGANVTWSLGYLNNHPNIASLSCTNCPSTTLTKINNGTVWLIATVTFPNSTTYTYEKYIGVGTPVIRGWYNSPTNPGEPLAASSRFEFNWNDACYTTLISTNMDITANSTVVWEDAGNSGGVTWYQSGNNLIFYFSDLDQWAYFRVTATNSCGSQSWLYRFRSVGDNCSGGTPLSIMLSPNPTTSALNVTLVDKKDQTKQKEIIEIRLVDKMGTVKQKWNYGKGSGNQTRQLNVSNLPSDIYNVMVYDGTTWVAKKFIKQ